MQQLSLFDMAPPKKEEKNTVLSADSKEETSTYRKLLEGTIVINICNNKKYKVKRDEGNVIEVFDKDYGYLMMARADLTVE